MNKSPKNVKNKIVHDDDSEVEIYEDNNYLNDLNEKIIV